MILDLAIESRKLAQTLDAPRKPKNFVIINKVTTHFSDVLFTPIVCTPFSRPIAKSPNLG